jgi:Lanthionine synthetase C-like protein/HopA1 effector protein family
MIDCAPGVRVYWNSTAEGALRLVACVTQYLNRQRVPFGLKVLTNSSAYFRTDSAVLYLGQGAYSEAIEGLIEIYQSLQPMLRPAVPAFTKAMIPGVGLAENPRDGASFGYRRSSLLAEAIVAAHEENAKSADSRALIYERVLQANDLDPDLPYLNPGSRDVYVAWRVEPRRITFSRRSKSCPLVDPLEIASLLGRRLSQNAIWSEGRCTWVGIETDLSVGPETASAFCWSTLDSGLYSGNAGVSLFLAHLARETCDSAAGETAVGALRQALTQLDGVSPKLRLGYYTGWAGVACAALDAGDVLNNGELYNAGLEVARRLAREEKLIDDRRTEVDFMTGKAGAMAALATRQELSSDPKLISFANRLAKQLVRDAVTCGRGLGWLNPEFADHLPLAGLSHGVSGIALALLEYDCLAPSVEVRRIVELGFEYERSVFDSRTKNWPDLRGQSSMRDLWHESHFLSAWCHGAPGIALARARAYALRPDPTLLQEYRVARDTTRRSIRSNLATDTHNCTLCHGVLGNAEVLALCGQILGEPEDSLVGQVAAQVCASAGPHLTSWPSDFAGETPPGLLLGLAGVGMFYLRRACVRAPSPLLPWIRPLKERDCGSRD